MTTVPAKNIEEARKLVRDRIIVALDTDTQAEAMELVDVLGDQIRYFKIGYRLFTRYGPQILEECARRGVEVFLDLKLYDIPSVVGRACAQIATHEAVFLTTVHASGGAEMVAAAVEGARSAGEENAPSVVAVTALTSFSEKNLPDIGVSTGVRQWASKLGALAIESGADGLVSSTKEVPEFRQHHGQAPILVTPGIRLPDVLVAGDDQSRTATPARALSLGSSFLVMGRPIYQAPDPSQVVEAIAESLVAK